MVQDRCVRWKSTTLLDGALKNSRGGRIASLKDPKDVVSASRISRRFPSLWRQPPNYRKNLLPQPQHGDSSYLVLTLEVLEKGLVKVRGDAVEQRPQYSLRKLVVIQIFDLRKHADNT